MSISLLSTKFYIPPARLNALSRPRLTEKMLFGVGQPGSFTLLSGPPGFGKTTLLAEFVAQLRRPVAWVSLDEWDNDPVRFWSYLIRACQLVQGHPADKDVRRMQFPINSDAPTGERQHPVGEAALALLRSPQPLPDDTIPTILINDLARLEGGMVLILDDYHVIQNPSIHTACLFLLEHLPGGLHIVLSTRVDPPWPLARFRARNRLVEVRAQDLRFTTVEAVSFLNQIMGLKLPPEDAAALEERTEGWAAGLQLAAIALQSLPASKPALSTNERGDTAGFIKAFTGSHVYVAEYLVEEVLQRQTEEVQGFLLQTSILDRLNRALCEAVTGCQDAQAMLLRLQHANLFVNALDDEGRWFRYHPLFSDLLRARLQQSQAAQSIAGLHQRASSWYEQEGMHSEAIAHALAAKDYPHAMQLIGKVALPMILQAYVRTVEGWLKAIPQNDVEESLKANMAFAWLHLVSGAFAQAAPYIDRLTKLFSIPDAANQDPAAQGEWLALQSKVLNVQGKPAESRDLAKQALLILPKANAAVRSMVLVNLATAYGQMLDYDHAIETFELIVQDARSTGDYTIEILGTAGQGQMLVQQGRLFQAFKIASDGIQRMEASGKTTPFSATLYGELGQVYYHWHQFEPSREHLRLSAEKSGRSGYSDPEIYRHIMLSRMSQVGGDWETAAQEMQAASDLARQIPPAMIREEVVSQQVRVDLAAGRLAAAREAILPEGFSFDPGFDFPELPPEANVPHPTGLLYNSALRTLLSLDRSRCDREDLKAGLALAERVLSGELRCRHIPIALETLLLRAQIHAALGDEQSGLADVALALEMAEPEGFISIFLEEGEGMRLLISDCRLRIEKTGPEQLRNFIDRLLEAFPEKKNQGEILQTSKQQSPISNLIEPLTSRELEVLQLIASGDSNRAIAEKLVVTVSAVKKHTANIYGKLDVNSRTQAVARARQLGLFSLDG